MELKIEIPQKEEWKRVNELAKQVQELHVQWRMDLFLSVENVINQEDFERFVEDKEIVVAKLKDEIVGYMVFNIRELIRTTKRGMIMMEFIKYDNIEDFMKDNFELILEKEWLNCLMVGNCLEAQKIGIEGWLLAKVTQNKQTELIMLYRKPWKLIMYSPTDNKKDELYKFAAEQQYKLVHPMKILVLEKMLPKQNSNEVVFKKATEKERAILTQYIKEFHKEALNEDVSDEHVNQKFESYLEKGYYFIEKECKIVSQAVIGRTLIKGKAISGVYTPKEERGKKYAYDLVYTLSKKCLENGAEYCVLYTDAENPISNHIYEKIGYVKRMECEELEFYE